MALSGLPVVRGGSPSGTHRGARCRDATRHHRAAREAACWVLIAGVLLATVLPAAELYVVKRDSTRLVTNPPPAASVPPSPPPPYRALIHEIAVRHGQPPELVESIIRVESNFNPQAVSRKGARGLMQLMPETARRLGIRNVFDARENIDGGVRHLRDLFARFSGDVQLALAAYNAGVVAVKHHRGIPPYAETRAYVERVLELSGWLEDRPLTVAQSTPVSRRLHRH